MATSKSSMPPSTCGGEVVGADDVGAGVAGLGGGLAGGEHRDPDVLAGARRQRDGAAHDLVGLAGVDAEAHRQLDVSSNLAAARSLDQLDAPRRACSSWSRSNRFDASSYFLPCRHVGSLVWSAAAGRGRPGRPVMWLSV